jgi:hypothetical protein
MRNYRHGVSKARLQTTPAMAARHDPTGFGKLVIVWTHLKNRRPHRAYALIIPDRGSDRRRFFAVLHQRCGRLSWQKSQRRGDCHVMVKGTSIAGNDDGSPIRGR